jgi:uncharacterized protein YdeI (YjbR/CyaY-like superfamily)
VKREAKPRFFKTPAEFRAWLEKNHDTKTELWVGLYKKHTGKPSPTWPEVVDQALCFGWIDGVRRSIDEDSYMNRVTPRTARSNWSEVNIKRVKELKKQGLMTPAGLEAFAKRSEAKAKSYSYERDNARLGAAEEKRFRANKEAWAFFESQPPSYRKAAIWWVVSAKKEETRERRLQLLIDHSKASERIPPLRPPTPR